MICAFPVCGGIEAIVIYFVGVSISNEGFYIALGINHSISWISSPL